LTAYPAQPVISAQRDHEHVRSLAAERPIDPAQSARRRVTADARVFHRVRQRGGIDLLLQQRGIRLPRIQPVTGGDAVAEDQDALLSGVCIPRVLGE
jgi:hypothetical protein